MPQKYRWSIKSKISDDLLIQLLYNRGVIKDAKAKPSELKSFLRPDTKKDLFDPFKLSDLKKACRRILLASRKKEKIGIFGDYDADGIPGAAILYEGLQKLGLEAKVYIPDRSEGYGLSKNAVEFFQKGDISLILTIDCGVRDLIAVNFAKKLGIDVIVCDHHEPGRTLPHAFAVIDPKRKGEKYPFHELSGAAVGFKLMQGLSKLSKKIKPDFLRYILDLVAISVISDIVPLISENRIFAKLGLMVLQKTKRIGLIELYKIAKIKPETINAYQVGFMIAPRINASGRMAESRLSFDLLTTRDKKTAKQLAQNLNETNKERQRETERFLRQARTQIKKNKLHKNKVILLQHDEWPGGLVGLMASKLKDEFNRPVFVFQKEKDTSRGSARSIDGFNLAEILLASSKLIEKGGGHAKAAGVEVKNEKMKEFYDYLLNLAEQKIKIEDLIPEIKIEIELNLIDINWQNYKILADFEPFGLGNPRPKFLTSDLEILQIKTMGNGEKHLTLILGKDDQNFRAVYFGGGEIISKLKRGDKIDAVYTIEMNDFTGQPKLELHLEDLKKS
jgi:single-stranded-DNA-specific exonuclease